MSFTELDLNSLPVWVIAVTVFLALSPKMLQGLGTYIPPLNRFLEHRQEQREARLHHLFNSQAAEQAHANTMESRMLDILEQSLVRMWEGQDELASRMNQLAHAVNRNNDLMTTLNVSVSKLSEAVRVIGSRDG